MQTAALRLWTRITDSISYDNNSHTKNVLVNTLSVSILFFLNMLRISLYAILFVFLSQKGGGTWSIFSWILIWPRAQTLTLRGRPLRSFDVTGMIRYQYTPLQPKRCEVDILQRSKKCFWPHTGCNIGDQINVFFLHGHLYVAQLQ